MPLGFIFIHTQRERQYKRARTADTKNKCSKRLEVVWKSVVGLVFIISTVNCIVRNNNKHRDRDRHTMHRVRDAQKWYFKSSLTSKSSGFCAKAKCTLYTEGERDRQTQKQNITHVWIKSDIRFIALQKLLKQNNSDYSMRNWAELHCCPKLYSTSFSFLFAFGGIATVWMNLFVFQAILHDCDFHAVYINGNFIHTFFVFILYFSRMFVWIYNG